MNSLYESIKQGLNEAIEYERGNLPNIRADHISVAPLPAYTASDIKAIRTQHGMTQKLFAEALGISVKTVEAWESGTNHPLGIANRMLELLKQDSNLFERYSIVKKLSEPPKQASAAITV